MLTHDWFSIKGEKMTRKDTVLESLKKRIPELEEKIKKDTKLLEELRDKKESLELEKLRSFLNDNGLTTEEIIAKYIENMDNSVHEQIIKTEDKKDVEH